MKLTKLSVLILAIATIIFGNIISFSNAATPDEIMKRPNESNIPTGILPSPIQVIDPNNINGAPTTTITPNINNENLLAIGPKLVIDLIVSLFGAVAIIIGLWAGTLIVFAHGDAKKVQQGIMALLYTVIGMAIVGGAWMLIRLILNINLGS